MELPPYPPHRLLDHIGLRIRDRAKALDAVELLQELLLLDGISVRIDRIGLLGHNGCYGARQYKKYHHCNEKPDSLAIDRHGFLLDRRRARKMLRSRLR